MLRFLLEKEFKQIIRDQFMPKVILMMPVMMLLIMPWAADQEIKNIKLSVVDNDHSTYSQHLIQKVTASGYFILEDISSSNAQALRSIESGKTDVILEIRPDFERDLVRDKKSEVMISSNAVNGTKGGLAGSYLSSILADYAQDININIGLISKMSTTLIQVMPYNKFNTYLDYKVFMVPALIVMLLTLLTGFLPALNIVQEKEIGTIEQINVTPVKRILFILGKLIPYWVIGFIVLTICFVLAAVVYNLTPAGSLLTIYFYAAIYVLVVSGLGLVISNYSATMQQAMFVMFFFMLILVLLSGLFTPISSMPDWAQFIAQLNPLTYFIQVMRSVYLKGSEVINLIPQLLKLIGFALFFNSWAILSYKKSQ